MRTETVTILGGPGSGNFAHSGRPGEVGGSSSGGGQIESPEFKAWFGRSKVVDASGKPKVMYHSTMSDISQFQPNTHFGTKEAAGERSDRLTSFYDETLHRPERSKGANVVPVYLKVEQPLRMPDLAGIDSMTGEPLPDNWDDAGPDDELAYPRGWEGEEAVGTTLLEMGVINIDEFEEKGRRNEGAFELLKEKGYDGVVYKNVVEDEGKDSWIVFDPTNIKSSIGNQGTFDHNNPIITLCGCTLPLAPEHGARLLARAIRSLGGEGSGNFDHEGRPGEVGGSGPGGGAEAESARLRAEAAVGITAVEKLLPNAIESADYQTGQATTWDDLSSDDQQKAIDKFQNNAYENGIEADTSDLDKEMREDLERDNEEVVARAEKEIEGALENAFPHEGTLLPLGPDEHDYAYERLPQYRQFDSETMTVDGRELEDLGEMRFKDGTPLTEAEQKTVERAWQSEYDQAFDDELQAVFEGEDYNERRNELENEAIHDEWNNFSDDEKFQYAPDDAKGVGLEPGEPDRWVTGLNGETGQNADRTKAVANELTRLRTEELLKERGLATREAHVMGVGNEWVVYSGGKSVGTYSTEAQAQERAKFVTEYEVTDPKELIDGVWSEWKGSSSSRDSLAFQLAAAKELGTHHRISEEMQKEILRDVSPARFAEMQAYARAQWETSQYVMQKANLQDVAVYRGLMLEGTTVDATKAIKLDKFGGAPSPNAPSWETYEKLPDISLHRAGLQSTTTSPSVANSWNGVGVYGLKNPQRVVLRVDAPRTSVMSLPVFGANVHEEREVVLIGTKDRWEWDAWVNRAPTFKQIPIKPLEDRVYKGLRAAADKLVIDLQKEDANRPHWLSNVQKDRIKAIQNARRLKTLGGSGSGNFGHAGRPGEVGGSAAEGGREFTSEEGYNWHEAGPVAEWSESLPYADHQAFADYASFGYHDINDQLRGSYKPRTVVEFVRPATPEEIARTDNQLVTDEHIAKFGHPFGKDPQHFLPDDPYNRVVLEDGTVGRLVHNVFYRPTGGEVIEYSVQRAVLDTKYVEGLKQRAETLNDAIAERGYAVPESMVLGRAAYIPGMSAEDLRAKVGETLEEKGFTSTMVGDANGRLTGYAAVGKFESLYNRFGAIKGHEDEVGTAMRMHITIPKGTKVASIEAVRRVDYDFPRIPDPAFPGSTMRDYSAQPTTKSHLGDKTSRVESEILLGSGAQFRITSVKSGGEITSSDKTLKSVPIWDVEMTYLGGGSSERQR